MYIYIATMYISHDVAISYYASYYLYIVATYVAPGDARTTGRSERAEIHERGYDALPPPADIVNKLEQMSDSYDEIE